MRRARDRSGPIFLRQAVVWLVIAIAGCTPEATLDGTPWTIDGGTDQPPQNPRPDPGFPCDVANVFLGVCSGCHSAQLNNGATAVLSTWDEVMQPSPRTPGKSLLDDSLARIRDGSMPPTGRKVDPVDLRNLEAWIARGAPKESCGVHVDPSLPDRGSSCSSGKWGTTAPGELMSPGTRCGTCHSEGGMAQPFGAAGTIYPSLHEPDGCAGESGVLVELTDRDGQVHSAVTNAAGNFVIREVVPLPFTVALRKGSRVYSRTNNVQATRDCNTCHSAAGASNAPGRIVLPP